MAGITFDNVTKTYGDGTRAVSDLNLDVEDGEFVVFVGPSGCGKTTALRMIAGLEEVSDGEIRIGERVVNNLQPRDRDVAMVFQNYALYPHMTVAENIGFALRMRKMSRRRHASSASSTISTASRASSPAVSVSGSRWGGRSCASHRYSSWTSRCRTSMRSCVCRCGRRSRASSASSASRPSTSHMTRSKR